MSEEIQLNDIHISKTAMKDERVAHWLTEFEHDLKKVRVDEVLQIGHEEYFKFVKRLCRVSRLIEMELRSSTLAAYEQAAHAASLFSQAATEISRTAESGVRCGDPLSDELVEKYRTSIEIRGRLITRAVEAFDETEEDIVCVSIDSVSMEGDAE